MSKSSNFENGKHYKFYKNLWNETWQIGTLRRVGDSYDIIVDLPRGYQLQLEKAMQSNDIMVSLNFTYKYGYKDVNIATMKVAFDIVSTISDVKKSMKAFCENVHYYILCRMNNRDVMLVVQENGLRSSEKK